MKIFRNILTAISATMLMLGSCSCSGKSDQTADAKAEKFVERGAFSADSAFAYTKRQVDFGPRVPGSKAHDECADWLVGRLKAFGADTVIEYRQSATAWNGDRLPVRNILARFKPDASARILLTAHYDTRPWADNDPDSANHDTPIDGANDGASGVAVLLEIARNLGIEPAEIGVDILLNDCEDYGVRQNSGIEDSEDTWCLGTQLFAANLPYTAANMPRYGILLDMVGGRDARFNREYFSSRYAQAPTAKIWDMAKKLGLADRFPSAFGGAITDDHLPLIRAGIPTADIIENASPVTGSFPPTWHTIADNIDNISPESLAAAGRVVLNVIYKEK